MAKPIEDESGVNILLEYIYTLIVTMVLFTIIVLMVANMKGVSDSIAIEEQLDVIANDVADRLSAFTSNVYMNSQQDDSFKAIIAGHSVYFELPQLVEGKQYSINISTSGTLGTVVVSYASNSNVKSAATFKALVPVKNATLYSQDGAYGIYYDGNVVEMRYKT